MENHPAISREDTALIRQRYWSRQDDTVSCLLAGVSVDFDQGRDDPAAIAEHVVAVAQEINFLRLQIPDHAVVNDAQRSATRKVRKRKQGGRIITRAENLGRRSGDATT